MPQTKLARHRPDKQEVTQTDVPLSDAEKRTALSVLITAAAGLLLYAHLHDPSQKVDATTLILCAVAALPWLTPFLRPLAGFFKTVEIAGLGKIEFKEPRPAEGGRAPEQVTDAEARMKLTKDAPDSYAALTAEKLPPDYYYLNHTSWLQPAKQTEYKQRTQVELPHFNIDVIVDSYYKDALERVERVEYVLHRSYPKPIQVRTNPEWKFLLSELANGEYVLMAKVFLKDRPGFILLQRYITLWEQGPVLRPPGAVG